MLRPFSTAQTGTRWLRFITLLVYFACVTVLPASHRCAAAGSVRGVYSSHPGLGVHGAEDGAHYWQQIFSPGHRAAAADDGCFVCRLFSETSTGVSEEPQSALHWVALALTRCTRSGAAPRQVPPCASARGPPVSSRV